MTDDNKIFRFLRMPEVEELSGLRRTQIKQAIRRGEFPSPVLLTPSGRAVAWDEGELLAWRESRLVQRGAA